MSDFREREGNLGVTKSILLSLRERELGRSPRIHFTQLPSEMGRKIDDDIEGTAGYVNTLKLAIQRENWEDVETAVGDIIMNLLNNTTNVSQLFNVSPKKKQQREFFVAMGGLQLLMQVFAAPFGAADARLISNDTASQKSEVWNEILVIIREVSFSLPSVSEKVYDNSHIVFLFTLLVHQPVFDNTMNLLEEILAFRIETFSLALIPNLFQLLGKLPPRQLAHFCRVLSLVLFEPEDRQIMDGSQVLRSIELLQLRRNRMTKSCSGIVEQNQSLVRGYSIIFLELKARLLFLIDAFHSLINLSPFF